MTSDSYSVGEKLEVFARAVLGGCHHEYSLVANVA